ncbi:AAA family ATPase [Acidiphilium sp.]|uniref:AAA family ATPase n=1 Tax=Acidiphilium sp. TaxID=527 RepID=UPI0025870BFF|nr:AAA family ATPase [Acidiphilium sp.]
MDGSNRNAAGDTPTMSPQPADLWVDDQDWIEGDIPRRPWIAPGYALRKALTVIVGPPGGMKSSLSLAWAVSLALGKPHGRFDPQTTAPVVIYNVEDDENEQRRRLSAVLRQFDAMPADIKGRVIRTGPKKVGTLVIRTDDGIVAETTAFANLKKVVTDNNARLVIIDPLVELHNVDENDNTAIRAVLAELRAFAVAEDVAIIVMHHTRKGAAANAGDPEIGRGASAIIGAARVILTLGPMTEDDAKAFGLPTDRKARSNYVRLDDGKANYSGVDDAAWFEKILYTLDNGEMVPAAVPWQPPSAKMASLEDLAALARAIENGHPSGEPWSPKLSGEGRAIRPLLEEHGFVGAAAQKAVMAKLATEYSVVEAKFKTRVSRNKVIGLRIGCKPDAEWLNDA